MDKRLHSRAPLEHRCRARFQLGDRQFSNIPVSNLGQDGCCIQVPAEAVGGLRHLTLLEGWKFINPVLPREAIKAKVVWVQGRDHARNHFLECGIKFLDAPMTYTRRLASYVKAVTPPAIFDLDDMDEMPEVPE
jgi:hypothetical protein